MSKLICGCDPGVRTGLAIWDCEKQKFENVETCGIISAMQKIRWQTDDIKLVRFEDARLRKGYYGKRGDVNHQGVGSVKRDCKIWQEFCEYYKIPFQAVAPQKGQTKWSSDYFKRVTGWTGRTSEHARDAAVLVFGSK